MPSGQVGQPAGDVALFFIGSFLQAFLSSDRNATAQWTVAGVAPASRPVESFVIARPDDKTYPFKSSQLPALFLWRDPGKFEVWGDDWDVVDDKVHVLWVLPEARPENQRSQLPFANAIVKCIFTGIELGRTPSWVQAGDPEPAAATQGSLLYTYAAFVHFVPETWRRTYVHLSDSSNRAIGDFPAVEMIYRMVENRVIGTDDPLRYKPLLGATDTISVATFVAFQTWTLNTAYTRGTFVVSTTSNGSYYMCVSTGQSGATQPTFPTVPGFYVNDGTTVWQCVGPTAYVRWAASTAYALNAFVIPPTANGFYYQATTPGASGATAPSFPATPGNTVADGTVVWTCVAATTRAVDSGPLETIAPSPV